MKCGCCGGWLADIDQPCPTCLAPTIPAPAPDAAPDVAALVARLRMARAKTGSKLYGEAAAALGTLQARVAELERCLRQEIDRSADYMREVKERHEAERDKLRELLRECVDSIEYIDRVDRLFTRAALGPA